jgi:hypothetical protein
VRSSLACALVFTAILVAASVRPASASTHPPPGTFNGCPHDALPLPAGPLSSYQREARIAALQFVRTSFVHISRTPRKLVGARTTGVFLVRHWLPSGWIKTECGIGAWRRSVGVNVYFPKMDLPRNPVGRCNDCARITFLASRTLGGWTIWGDH